MADSLSPCCYFAPWLEIKSMERCRSGGKHRRNYRLAKTYAYMAQRENLRISIMGRIMDGVSEEAEDRLMTRLTDASVSEYPSLCCCTAGASRAPKWGPLRQINFPGTALCHANVQQRLLQNCPMLPHTHTHIHTYKHTCDAPLYANLESWIDISALEMEYTAPPSVARLKYRTLPL